MDSFSEFYAAYMECALWSSTDDDGVFLDARYGIESIALETKLEMERDCRDFVAANYEDLARHGTAERCGHDFWLSRNGHGTGFWDRGTGDVGKRLHNTAKIYGSCGLYIGDDDFIYCV